MCPKFTKCFWVLRKEYIMYYPVLFLLAVQFVLLFQNKIAMLHWQTYKKSTFVTYNCKKKMLFYKKASIYNTYEIKAKIKMRYTNFMQDP